MPYVPRDCGRVAVHGLRHERPALSLSNLLLSQSPFGVLPRPFNANVSVNPCFNGISQSFPVSNQISGANNCEPGHGQALPLLPPSFHRELDQRQLDFDVDLLAALLDPNVDDETSNRYGGPDLLV
jgi:hypothetical protein